MPTQWNDTIRQTGQLTVKFNAQIRSSVWSNVASRSISQFNRLTRQHHIGVRLVATSSERANVMVNLINGTTSFTFENAQHNVSLSGDRLHGRTYTLTRSNRIIQAYVFLPANPQINTPGGPRGVGNGVKLMIAVHEFIHCCGLSDNEHTNNDIFVAYPSVDYGSTPQRDVVEIQPRGGRHRRVPPLFLGSTTTSRLRTLWPLQRRRARSRSKRASILQDGIQNCMSMTTDDVQGGQREQGPVGFA